MEGWLLRFCIALAGLALPFSAAAQSASSTGTATASIIEPLRATPVADLSFGTLTVGTASGGEVTVSAVSNLPQYTGTVAPACGPASECRPHAARFAVSGEANRFYRISVPASVQARGTQTGQLLQVSDLSASSINRPAANGRGQLDTEGKDNFTVGGTLTVPAATSADTFRAEIAVSVYYD